MKKKFKGFSYEDGRIVKSAYLNGYWFCDRLLEGVYFKITVNDDGSLSGEIVEAHKEYMSDLNSAKFLKEAIEFAAQTDYLCENEDGTGEDLMLEEI